jgi:hypothetical protein
MAQTLSVNLNDIVRIDRMSATLEVRRNVILRELERHRTTSGQNLSRAAPESRRLDSKLIETKPPTRIPAASRI